MNFGVKTSLGILFLIVLIAADVDKFDEQCQSLHCNPATEICRLKPQCNINNDDILLKCVYCALKSQLIPSEQQPLAPRLLAKSEQSINSNQSNDLSSNRTSKESSYDDYYDYEDEDIGVLYQDEFDEEDDYLNDYTEPSIPVANRSRLIRKAGSCPKVLASNTNCTTARIIQPDCRFDTDCPGDLKCCESMCRKRTCVAPIKILVSTCPTSFQCTLNCPLGYRTDSNGCLKCECQTCPPMDQCLKNCPAGYLKDLFGCDVCECNDRCPPFSCDIVCPSGIGFLQSDNGCPLCECDMPRPKPIEHASLCQEDVHCPPGFRCLIDAFNVPMCQAVASFNVDCPNDIASTCDLHCPNDNYVLDENGCPTCNCAPKAAVECSRVMCRMYCQHGFKRDENGCEYCACNDSPQPCPQLDCLKTCKNGYRKDYSGCERCECDCPDLLCSESTSNCTQGFKKDENGCSTCTCDEPVDKVDITCEPLKCSLKCKYGLQRDENGCKMCACNRCSLRTCRMFCMFGFRRNEEGCEVCECDWTPVSEKIQCSERIPCPGTRVCNMNLRLCEAVDPDRVNWFLYDFEVYTDMFNDPKFVQTFKNGLINNIAKKYGLEVTQIAVSAVQEHGLTSFQIMPFFSENMEDFEKKMDQIDIDLNSHEFRSVLPAIVDVIDDDSSSDSSKNQIGKFCHKFKNFVRTYAKSIIRVFTFFMILLVIVLIVKYISMCRRRAKASYRSESKSPICDTAYQRTATDDDHYHAVHAPDGTQYVILESEDPKLSSENRVLV